jgi:YidC/Oxa1 family membrane protein insertase
MVFASFFQVLIVKPIFNLLVIIYAWLPGHNFGLAIILFTILVRLLMWPLVKKQLHQAKLTRAMQPEIKRVKAAAKGDRQKEQLMLMELYKERGISPFGSLGTIIVQFVILIGLYSGLRHVATNSRAILENAYTWVSDFSWMQILHHDITRFDHTLFHVVDLTKAAVAPGQGVYWPAMVLVVGSAAIQYMTSKQLMPKPKDGRSLRRILKEAGTGKESDQTEVTAALSRGMIYAIPVMILLFTINLPAALSLYWLVGGIVAYIQQGRILGTDEEEMEAIADKDDKKKASRTDIIEGEIIEKPEEKSPTPKPKSHKANKKRRKK